MTPERRQNGIDHAPISFNTLSHASDPPGRPSANGPHLREFRYLVKAFPWAPRLVGSAWNVLRRNTRLAHTTRSPAERDRHPLAAFTQQVNYQLQLPNRPRTPQLTQNPRSACPQHDGLPTLVLDASERRQVPTLLRNRNVISREAPLELRLASSVPGVA